MGVCRTMRNITFSAALGPRFAACKAGGPSFAHNRLGLLRMPCLRPRRSSCCTHVLQGVCRPEIRKHTHPFSIRMLPERGGCARMRKGHGMRLSIRQAIGLGAIAALELTPALNARASTAYDIDLNVGAALDRFYHRGPWSRSFVHRAAGKRSSRQGLVSAASMARAAC